MKTSNPTTPASRPALWPFLLSGSAFGVGSAVIADITPAGTILQYTLRAAWAAVTFGVVVAVLPQRRLRHLSHWQVAVLAAVTIGITVLGLSWMWDRLFGVT